MITEKALPALSRILVATDLSARSDRAVERAVMLAKQTHTALTILHVVDADLPNKIADRLHDDARSLIADHLATLPSADAVSPEIRVVFGKDHKDIVEIANKSAADLIVLGIHRNESGELFGGTTAERVIRTGTRPVLMVKVRAQAFYRRVIVGVDFSDCSRRAIEFAARLIPDGEFHLVHAFDVPFKAFLTSDDTQREFSKSHQEQMDQFVGEEFSALRTALSATPARLCQVVRQGEVRQVVQEQIDRLRPDLLVLGTHGRSGIAHAVYGSVAEDFLSHPPCDVLAVPPDARSGSTMRRADGTPDGSA
jgi:universal stress protein E